jgi:adenine-specific DNA-methyltransferase
MDKLKMHSPDLTEQNIARLAELFPNCFTEAEDKDGKPNWAIDFDQLRQELSGTVVDGPRERYHLDWPGKKQALLAANAPVAKTLRPCREESVNFDATKNVFIEGDNLDALKLLQETYLNKIKMIYIDPPYNTGRDFVYSDAFAETSDSYLARSNQTDSSGNRLVANSDANGRFHSDWLSMLYSRLRLSRNLLRDNGVIFVSIDDNEVANLMHICDEIFGEQNCLGTIVWKKKTNGNNMGFIPPVHDYIVCYARTASEDCLRGFALGDEFIESKYSNPDDDSRGPWTTSDLSANHKGPHFPIANPNTGEVYTPPEGRYWVFNAEEVDRRIADGRIIFGKTGNGRPVQKKFLSDRDSLRKKAESWWDKHGMNADGTKELGALLKPKIFDHSKPSITLRHLCDMSTQGDDIVLDFFAGSGTMAHAVLDQNSSDGERRRFILVQIAESCQEDSEAYKAGFRTISDLAKERIRRVGSAITQGGKTIRHPVDTGFRVLKLDTSNMKDVYYAPDSVKQGDLPFQVENIKEDRTPEDLLFQVLLDWGVDLSLPISEETVEDKTVFFVDGNALAACFDKDISEELVKTLAARKPLRAVFRDSGYGNDSVKINVEQIFKLISPSTEVKSI